MLTINSHNWKFVGCIDCSVIIWTLFGMFSSIFHIHSDHQCSLNWYEYAGMFDFHETNCNLNIQDYIYIIQIDVSLKCPGGSIYIDMMTVETEIYFSYIPMAMHLVKGVCVLYPHLLMGGPVYTCTCRKRHFVSASVRPY